MADNPSIHLQGNPELDTFYTDGGYFVTPLSDEHDYVYIAGEFASLPDAYELAHSTLEHVREMATTPEPARQYAPELESFIPLSAIARKVMRKREEAIGASKAASLDPLYLPTEWVKANLRTVQTDKGDVVAAQVVSQDMLRSSGLVDDSKRLQNG